MKSRRRIASLKAQDYANSACDAGDQIRKLRSAEWALAPQFALQKFLVAHVAFGSLATFPGLAAMSALPPITTEKADIDYVG
jgi:hypothetical protein